MDPVKLAGTEPAKVGLLVSGIVACIIATADILMHCVARWGYLALSKPFLNTCIMCRITGTHTH